MKRRFYLMLVVAMIAMTLVACGSDTNDTTNTTNDDVTVNTEVEESGETVVPETSVEDPVETPEVEEPVVEAEPTPDGDVNGENETFRYEYSHDFVFPEGMNGFTKKYLNEDYPEWSVNQTHYVDSYGNEMNFSWEGLVDLGEQAWAGERTLVLSNSDRTYQLQAWTYGLVDETKFAADLDYSKDTWTSFAATDTPYVENGYYDIQTSNTIIEVIFEVANDTQKGYNYYIVDLNRETCYQFAYLENIDIYDNDRAMTVVENLDFWDYTPEEITNE